jgi:hypothetical protein
VRREALTQLRRRQVRYPEQPREAFARDQLEGGQLGLLGLVTLAPARGRRDRHQIAKVLCEMHAIPDRIPERLAVPSGTTPGR